MSPPNLLTIPREIRQRILKYTRPDYDLRIDCKPTFIGWKFVPQYTHKETSKWVCNLCLVNSEMAQDMVWVQQQWFERGEQLAREQKRKKRTRIGNTWTKKSRAIEKHRAVENCRATLKAQQSLLEEQADFTWSNQIGWIAHFRVVPDNWMEVLLQLGWAGWLMKIDGVDRLFGIRRVGYPELSPDGRISGTAF
ncbi:hypothetical protein FKW77_002360 [Venturia effusa]|uniref:Uncharacterized protein n=1 Tax=Venturia effusa TaxID=50376 RepID=A0A517LI97_9PEZI|nr:hypothetical protein FKW77_002360 [Venturia effusa]